MKKNENGFSAVEGILIFVVICLIGFIGWYVWQNKSTKTSTATTPSSTTTTNTNSTSSTSDPYTGWKSYTLTKEKLSFKYPASLTIKDSTSSSESGDSVVLSGANGFKLYITTGLFDFALPTGGAAIDSSEAITFASQKGYLNYYEPGSKKTDAVTVVSLGKNDSNVSDFFATKNASASASGQLNINVQFIDSSNNQVAKKVADIKSNSDFKNAKLLIQSMSY